MARATATEGELSMIVTIAHVDQVYVLQEALEDFAAKIEPSRQWRASAAVQDLLAQVNRIAEQDQSE